MRVTNGKGYQTSGRNLQRIKSFFHVCWATNQSTKRRKKLLKFRADLYNQCLDDHLLEKGSELVRQHLDEVKAEMKLIDDHIEELIVEKDAYRIELEVFEDKYREKMMPVKKESEEEEE